MLILGDTGLVGTELVKVFKNDYEIVGLSRSDKKLNYKHIVFDNEKDSIEQVLEDERPNIIVSCTRGDFDAQYKVHESIVDFSKKNDVNVHFYSTANAFDGDPTAIKYEDSEPLAETDYGKYKISVEKLVQSLGESGIIIRLPMVLGPHAPRVNQLISCDISKEKVAVFKNLHTTIILASQIAFMHHYIIEKDLKGIFHFASRDLIDHDVLFKSFLKDTSIVESEDLNDYYLAIQSNRPELNHFNYSTESIIESIKANRKDIYE